MKFSTILLLASSCLLSAGHAKFLQDPCANCDEGKALQFQRCILEHGNPCAEYDEAGIVTKVGTKKDVGCCLVKEKHHRCLKCKEMDCSHNTCKVNKKYYSERTLGEPPLDTKAEMKKDGWGR